MGIAAWLVWSKGGWTPNKFPLSSFAVQVTPGQTCLRQLHECWLMHSKSLAVRAAAAGMDPDPGGCFLQAHAFKRQLCMQLLLNWAWNPSFFLLRKLDVALIDIVLLLGALTTTGVAFWQVDHRAGALFVPYFAWVAFASAPCAACS